MTSYGETAKARSWRVALRVGVLLLGSTFLANAQEPPQASIGSARDASVAPDGGAKLAFSEDGKVLHAIESRAITYDADTGAETKIVALAPDSSVPSVTSDGRTAIVALGISGAKIHLLLLDTETGQSEDIPSGWYDPTDPEVDDALSGDGRLISFYSENGPADQPLSVSVYDWPGKTLVAKRTSEYFSAGGAFGGGVTVDGAVEFDNDRVGVNVVDLKTGRLMGTFGLFSIRSPDGAWVIEFPDLSFDETAPKDVLVKDGANGQTRGKLDLQVADDEVYGSMNGAFCGTTGRFVVGRGRGVAMYDVRSGALLASFPATSWRDATATNTDSVEVACSSTGTRVAILSGTRLTIHDLK
jgi:hypothetical protein